MWYEITRGTLSIRAYKIAGSTKKPKLKQVRLNTRTKDRVGVDARSKMVGQHNPNDEGEETTRGERVEVHKTFHENASRINKRC